MKLKEYYFIKEMSTVHSIMLMVRRVFLLSFLIIGFAYLREDSFVFSTMIAIGAILLSGGMLLMCFNLRYLYASKIAHNRLFEALKGLSLNEYEYLKKGLPVADKESDSLAAVFQARVDEQFIAEETYVRQRI